MSVGLPLAITVLSNYKDERKVVGDKVSAHALARTTSRTSSRCDWLVSNSAENGVFSV